MTRVLVVYLAGCLPSALVVFCPAAAAQERSEPTNASIVVTGSRTGDSDQALSTITASDIARLQPPTLLDALNDIAGVRAVSTGGIGGGSFVSIRGGEPNFTLVLIDGVRVTNSTNAQGGAFDFSLIDPGLVEKVEVDRGATSAVQGSDALSGVINIRLRDPAAQPSQLTGRISTGTDGEVGGGATASQQWHGGGLLIGASAFSSGSSDPASRLERQQGIARLHQEIADYDVTALGLYAHNHHSEFPLDSGGPEFAVNRTQETGSGELWLAALALRRRPGTSVVQPNLSISWSHQRDDTVTPAIAPGALNGVPATNAWDQLHRLEVIGDVTIKHRWLTASLGSALLEEHAQSTGSIDFGFPVPTTFRLDRRTLSGFAEVNITPVDALNLNAAVRRDIVSNGLHEWTGRASVSWQPWAQGPSIFARIDQGFKLPSFYALGNPLVGDPTLKPERSLNHEAGIEWSRNSTFIRIAFFDDHFRDLIDFDPTVFRLVNRSRVEVRGVEAEAKWQPTSSLSLATGLNWLNFRTATPLLDRPRWAGNLRLAWRMIDSVNLTGALRFNGRFFDSSVPTGLVVTDSHVEADIGARWQMTQRIELSGTLRNLTNNHADLAVGYPQIGRRLMLTLSVAHL